MFVGGTQLHMSSTPRSPHSARSRAPIDNVAILWWEQYGVPSNKTSTKDGNTEHVNHNYKAFKILKRKLNKSTNTNEFITKYFISTRNNNVKKRNSNEVDNFTPTFEEARRIIENFFKMKFSNDYKLQIKYKTKDLEYLSKAFTVNRKLEDKKSVTKEIRNDAARNIDPKSLKVIRGGETPWYLVKGAEMSGDVWLPGSSGFGAGSRAAGVDSGPRGDRVGRENYRMPVS